MNVSNKTVRIWRKNLKQGYRFFEPHNATQLAPRTLKEAYGYNAYQDIRNTEFNLAETEKAYIIGFIILIACIALWLF